MSTTPNQHELQASSEKSFEDAIQQALAQASANTQGIQFINVKSQSCRVEDNRIVEYRVAVSFSQENATELPTTHNNPNYIQAPEGVISDFSDVEVPAHSVSREEHQPGSATAPESGGGYSG